MLFRRDLRCSIRAKSSHARQDDDTLQKDEVPRSLLKSKGCDDEFQLTFLTETFLALGYAKPACLTSYLGGAW